MSIRSRCLGMVISFALVACGGSSAQVDSGLVGSWELMVPNEQGVARWVWDIHTDGTYAFHAEGPGNVPSHSGVFEARKGRYQLRSTTLAWADTGTYQLTRADSLKATGKLGTGYWHRVGQEPSDSASYSTGDSTVDKPGVFAPPAILAHLLHRSLDADLLEPPFKSPQTEAAAVDKQDEKDGVIGEVRTVVQSPAKPGEISLRVYRDRSAAATAYQANAVFDAPTFRSARGEMVASHGYGFKRFGEARCLSRNLVGESSEASVTCYLLVSYPTDEAVIIESRINDRLTGKSLELSQGTIDQASDLVLAGFKYWVICYQEMGGAAGN